MKKKSLISYLLPLFSLFFLILSCADNNKSINKESISQESVIDDSKPQFWIWLYPREGESDELITERYKRYYAAGIRGVFFGADNEQHFKIAQSQGLETHLWMWIMNRGEENLRIQHPEWYAKNRKGESCFDKPPYVDYYRWLCPSRPEVVEYIKTDVDSILRKDYIDGIHLDYIRFCDVVLPVNLWKSYNIVQKQELPEYDYCYCEVCKQKFREEYKQDLDSIEYPEESLSWRKYRYDAITNVVNQLSEVASTHNKAITAAVFPTPDVAKRLVRQDWTNWKLKAVFPMIYHGFYKENTSWIGTAVSEGMRGLDGRFPLYAGLFIPDFKNMDDLKSGIQYALDNGASGVSLFGELDDNILNVLSEF